MVLTQSMTKPYHTRQRTL